jgi:uncharacterized membrane protein (UPF0127 family)
MNMPDGRRFPIRLLFALVIIVFLTIPCGLVEARDPSAAPKAPSFKKITVSKTTLRVEVADTLEKQERGLMFRQSMPENEGMLFVYREPQELAFWMRNTFIPLDIAFVGADGLILNIHQAGPLDESILYRSAGAAKYVIETNQGWFSRNGIGPGDKVSFGR